MQQESEEFRMSTLGSEVHAYEESNKDGKRSKKKAKQKGTRSG